MTEQQFEAIMARCEAASLREPDEDEDWYDRLCRDWQRQIDRNEIEEERERG